MNVKSLGGKLQTSVLHCSQVWFPPAIPKKQKNIPEDFCATAHFDLVLHIRFINYLNILE